MTVIYDKSGNSICTCLKRKHQTNRDTGFWDGWYCSWCKGRIYIAREFKQPLLTDIVNNSTP